MRDHVRLMLLCPTCTTGLHLPVYAAQECAAFTDHGLEVELVLASSCGDATLAGRAVRVTDVARGVADFGLTPLPHVLAAQADAGASVPVRFISPLHRRSPIVGVVAARSVIHRASDLAGKRTARHAIPWFVAEYEAALRHHRLGPPALMDGDGPYGAESLGRGEVDVLPLWADAVPVVREHLGVDVRLVPLDIPFYASGFLAADRIPDEVVLRTREALAEGLEVQRRHPEVGIGAYHRRFPDIGIERLRLSWALFEPYAASADEAADEDMWLGSLNYAAAAHGLPSVAFERAYRWELFGSGAPMGTAV